MALISPQVKLVPIRRKSFREQAVWFLNSTAAGDSAKSCELVRSLEEKCSSLHQTTEESVVDELAALRLLESSDKPCTRAELRSFLETISSDDRPRRISLAELLIYRFGYDWRALVNKPECRKIENVCTCCPALEKVLNIHCAPLTRLK